MNKQEAADRGCVPCSPFTRVLREWVSRQDQFSDRDDAVIFRPLPLLAERTGLNVRTIRHFLAGPPWISFDSADRIICVCLGGLWGWQQDPELWSIYQSVDFGYLDRTKSCITLAA